MIITAESFGQMDVKDMFLKSIDLLKEDLEEVGKKIVKQLSFNINSGL